MRDFFLTKGLVIQYQGEHLEFSGRCSDELYFESPHTGRRETLQESRFWELRWAGDIQVVPAFSSSKQLVIASEQEERTVASILDVEEKYQEEAIRRFEYVSRLAGVGITIGQTTRIASELGKIAALIQDKRPCPSVTTVRRWWRALLNAERDTAILISRNAFKTRTMRICTASESFVQEQIDVHYLQKTRPSVSTAYQAYRGAIALENEQRQAGQRPRLAVVSEKTFYNRIQARPKNEVAEARYGREEAIRQFRMVKGITPATYPLDVVEIDHTPMNLYVIDDLSYLPLGRPWLTAVRDRYSGVLLGFYISFQATGLSSIFGAIKHSLFAHHRAMERWGGLQNAWPAFGRGLLYASDRGPDFTCLRYRAAITALGSMYEHCERRTPWLKGSVERFFLTLEQTFFEAIPGRTFANLNQRFDYNPVEHAVIRFSALTYLLHKWAVDYHNIIPNSRNGASPLELWNEGIANAPPPYPASIDKLNVILGHRHEGVVSHEGIRFKRLNFTADELQSLMMQVGSGTKLEFVVSSEDLGFIQVKDPRNASYIKAYCTRPDYADGLTLLQHDYLRAAARADLKAGGGVDALVRARRDLMETIAEECARKENKAKVRLARIAGLNSNSAILGVSQTLQPPVQRQEQQLEVPELLEPPVTNIRPITWGV